MYLQAYVQQELQAIKIRLAVAQIRMVLGKGHWNSFIRQKARSLGIELSSDLNFEKYMYRAVQNKLSKSPAEEEDAAEWCLAYLFIPEAIGSDAEDLFSKFKKKQDDNSERKHNFAGYFSSYIPNAIKQYMRSENKRLENQWDEDDAADLENKVKNLEVKFKHEVQTDPHSKEKIPFGLSGADIESLHSLTDLVEEAAYKDLKIDLMRYVKDNDQTENQFAYKVLRLKYDDPDYSGQELAEELKTTPKTISIVINKGLKKLVAEYAAQLKKKYGDPTLFRTMLHLDLVPKGVTANNKLVVARLVSALCNKLENFFN